MIGFFDLKSAITPDSERKFRVWLTWFFILSILALMIHTMFDSLRKPDVWRFIGEHLNQIHHSSQVMTVVTCFVYAIVILVLRLRAAASERWADFICAAFMVLVIDYLILFWLSASGPTPAPDWLANIFGTLLSALNNVFLIAAGLVLLDRDPFPRWNIIMQAVFAASGMILSLQGNLWQRFPDATASAFCIYWIGYALYRNIRYTNSGFSELTRKIAGQVVLASVLLYALTGFFWASIPFITNRMGTRKLLLDSAVILLFFLLKFVIFLATLFLLLGAIIFVSSKHANEIFDPIVNGVSEYLTGDGVTKLVADRLDAAAVVLYVTIPGKKKNRYAKFTWPYERNSQSTQYEPLKVNLSEMDDLALEAIRSGEEQRLSLSRRERLSLARYFPLTYANQLPTKIAVPIIFHGAVIGCLLVISKPDRNFSLREIQHLRDLAKLSTLSMQSFRENAALDQLSFRFSRAVALKPAEPSPKLVRKSDFDKVIKKIVEVLHDVLNPLATGIWLDTGLQRCVSLAGDEKLCQELKRVVDTDESSLHKAPSREFGVLMANLQVKQDEPKEEIYTIGKLAILVPAERDELGQPVLGRNQMHFRAVTARTISVLIGTVTEYLDSVIREFGVKINKLPPASIEEWFGQLKTAADKAGVLWIVVELSRECRALGEGEAVEAFQRLRNNDGENGVYLRSAPLRHSFGKLRIGVGGSIYDDQRNVCPLWKPSFFEFAEIADSALQRMISNQEKILHLEHQAAHSYEFATIAVTTAEIVHQIVNTTRDISLPLKSLYEAYLMGKLNCVDERMGKLIAALPQYASNLIELTADFKKLSDPKENIKCHLRQAVEQAERLYALQLKKRDIVLESDIPDFLTIGVPPHVAVLALATLVGNSRDAASDGGHIKIRAWEEGDMVRCDVTDNGHGVPVEVQARLFRERNVTTKSNGNGWGLYLVSRSLKDRHGSIELTSSHPGETIFTIRFPKYSGGVRA